MFLKKKHTIKLFIIIIFILIFSFQLTAANSTPEIKSDLIDSFNVHVKNKEINGITFSPFLNKFGFTLVQDTIINKDNPFSEFTTFIEGEDNKLYKANSAYSHFKDNKWFWIGETKINGKNIKITHVFKLKELMDNKDLNYLNMKVIISSKDSIMSLKYLKIYNEIPAANYNELEDSIVISSLNKQEEGINSFLALFDYTEDLMLKVNSDNNKVLIGREVKLNNFNQEKTVWENNFINVKAWGIEIVNNLVYNLKNYQIDIFPELKVYGFTDQKEVKKDDVITYTYLIMNTGMDVASNIKLEVDIVDGFSYLENSSKGDQGILILEPLGKEKKILESEEDLIINNDVNSLLWKIAGEIRPTEIKTLNFKVRVK